MLFKLFFCCYLCSCCGFALNAVCAILCLYSYTIGLYRLQLVWNTWQKYYNLWISSFPLQPFLRVNHGMFRDGGRCSGFSIARKVCDTNKSCLNAVVIKFVVHSSSGTRAPLVACPFKICEGMLNRFVLPWFAVYLQRNVALYFGLPAAAANLFDGLSPWWSALRDCWPVGQARVLCICVR